MGLETLALTAIIAGTAVNAYTSIQAGKEAEFSGEVDANLNEQAAVIEEQQGEAEAQAIRDRSRRLMGSQRASFLKSGLTLDGTASDVIYDSALEGELEALNARYRSKIGAMFSRKEAAMSRYSGKAQKRAYYAGAAGTVLSGVGSGLSLASRPGFG